MPIIDWSESYSVKIAEIDRQHQKLIAMINDLNDAMKEGKGKNVLGKIISGLASYTKTHFKTEERYFDRYNYPGTETHKKEHEKFVQTVRNFQQEFENGQIMLTIDVMSFLSDWLVKHIKGSDQKYSQFLNEKGLV